MEKSSFLLTQISRNVTDYPLLLVPYAQILKLQQNFHFLDQNHDPSPSNSTLVRLINSKGS